MINLSKISNVISDASAAMITVGEGGAGQRIDNFLCKTLKGVPKRHIYSILRSGEVRVNKKRIDATYRLAIDDLVMVRLTRTSIVAEDVISSKNITPIFEQ